VRIARRAKTRQAIQLDGNARRYLERGRDYFQEFVSRDESVREMWRRVGEQITSEWVERQPGSRPAAWWWFDSPDEPRRVVSGTEPPDAPRDNAARSFGRWRKYYGPNWHRYESEPAYLRRHDLLRPGERERIAAADFEATD